VEGLLEIKRFLINFKYAFNFKKPLLTLRLIWNFIRILIFKKCLLRYVDLAIGYKCNLSCPHCFSYYRKREFGRMPPHHFAKVVKDAMRLGAVNFSFQGGEPLLYPDLKDYIKAAQPFKNLISISTNGTLLTYEKAKELKSWGVDIVTISLDSFRQLPDNVLVDPFEGIDNAKRAGLKVTIASVVTHQNINDEFLGNLRMIATLNKIILFLIFAVPIGRWEGKSEVMLTKEDVERIRRLEKSHHYLRTDFQANYYKKGCGAAKELIYINPYGEVFCCPFIQIPFGNLRKMPLWKIRERMLKVNILWEYHQKCIAGEEGGLWKKF
jgi:MoaA/NifB/PqqE/SkfB family radical SAM enzyme